MAGKKNTTAKADLGVEVQIEPISSHATNGLVIVGTTPLLLNRLSEKARRQLLMPSPRKNQAERAGSLKHDPLEEYRSSVYRTKGDDAGTRICFPGGGVRRAIATAALDTPGATKAQVGRLVKVLEYDLEVYGVPKISCMIVRMADVKRTPDVRTRAILPKWCADLTVQFAHPVFKERAVLNLLATAGDFVGIGDGRPEKGSSLTFGCFRITTADDPEVIAIKAEGGREAQDEALESPTAYDLETEGLLTWFHEEVERRDYKKQTVAGRKEVMEQFQRQTAAANGAADDDET